jgi:hypothetical protein
MYTIVLLQLYHSTREETCNQGHISLPFFSVTYASVLNAERAAVIHLRDQGRIDDDVLRTIERELDLEDQRLRRA